MLFTSRLEKLDKLEIFEKFDLLMNFNLKLKAGRSGKTPLTRPNRLTP